MLSIMQLYYLIDVNLYDNKDDKDDCIQAFPPTVYK